MRKSIRGAAALVLGSALTASAAAQPPAPGAPPATPPAGVPATPPVGGAPGAAAGLPGVAPSVTPAAKAPEVRPTGTAATVNGKAIPEVAVYRALRQFPDAHKEMARKEIMAHLIENALIDEYLTLLKVTVDEKDVNKLIGDLKKELTDAKKDYTKELEAMMLTEAEFRTEVTAQMKWEKFVQQQGTDAALKQLFDSSPEVFDGTMVRARHILMTPGTDEAKQKDAAQKLRGIKQVVEQEAAKAVAALPPTADALAKEQARTNKTDELFAAYAKEYSTCPSKKDGGDLNFFPRAGAMVEPFAKAAFALKPYEMTDVVATEFGYHLILVTSRRQGAPKKFEDKGVKEDVQMLYAMRLRESVITMMKPKAQITIAPK
ncbi:-type peptidyl-prolyl cis-trans isomerase : Peptidylprolyl isomerase OS=uncultured planctomycete GN=HGMM_F12C05C36 PE=4 SV=1: Rotamase [Gemmata massiliana]|uniref:PpiC domain-containing protein n=1 Tax=Gemmata massiliana TaxID=1210884 RepID=A0A6P2D8P5_9BACT|nr:peptidylprolyl isomerase [Gemmata massiliana]VTR96745.1 -type peptidyl-prolyl cis-trans isomerase : Peptidylprolyl isomerase OS=uncultured planctomycete GN=HGMM_F12C05C36 PE=4 SV=1: Rotamase [Gemmata massiliana]